MGYPLDRRSGSRHDALRNTDFGGWLTM